MEALLFELEQLLVNGFVFGVDHFAHAEAHLFGWLATAGLSEQLYFEEDLVCFGDVEFNPEDAL